jgi:hypothetical protein
VKSANQLGILIACLNLEKGNSKIKGKNRENFNLDGLAASLLAQLTIPDARPTSRSTARATDCHAGLTARSHGRAPRALEWVTDVPGPHMTVSPPRPMRQSCCPTTSPLLARACWESRRPLSDPARLPSHISCAPCSPLVDPFCVVAVNPSLRQEREREREPHPRRPLLRLRWASEHGFGGEVSCAERVQLCHFVRGQSVALEFVTGATSPPWRRLASWSDLTTTRNVGTPPRRYSPLPFMRVALPG